MGNGIGDLFAYVSSLRGLVSSSLRNKVRL